MADDVVAVAPLTFLEKEDRIARGQTLQRMVFSAKRLEAPLLAFEAATDHDALREERRAFLVEFRYLAARVEEFESQTNGPVAGWK